MTTEAADDLRIAIDEACSWLLEQQVTDPLHLCFEVADRELTLEIRAGLAAAAPSEMPGATRRIPDAVTAAWTFSAADGTALFHLRAPGDESTSP